MAFCNHMQGVACVQVVIVISFCHALVTEKPCVGKFCDSGKNKTSTDLANEMDIKYGLVPIFLVGASGVIILYIVMHCLYLHCYAKRKMESMASKNRATTTILLNDGENQSNVRPVTPVVKYQAPYGKTEIMQATPYLVENKNAQNISNSNSKPVSKRSSLKNILNNMSNSNKPSLKSYEEGMANMSPPPGTQASICFVPMGKPITDPSGSTNNWTLLQGFVYSHIHLSSNGTCSIPCTEEVTKNHKERTSPTGVNNDNKTVSKVYVPSANLKNNGLQFECIPDAKPVETTCVPKATPVNERTDNEFDQIDDAESSMVASENDCVAQPSQSTGAPIELAAEVHNDNSVVEP